MQATRFPTRSQGIADRMADFMAHLRMNGLHTGPRELRESLEVLGHIDPLDPDQVRRAEKVLCSGGQQDWDAFDDLFDAFWFNAGRQRRGETKTKNTRIHSPRPMVWQQHLHGHQLPDDTDSAAAAEGDAEDGEEEVDGGDGRLIATRQEILTRRDLRELTDEETLRQAEQAAEALARRLRDRRSRRYRLRRRGAKIDLRSTLRHSLASGGEPFDLHRRKRRDRPYRLVALCDVSGSMTPYARVFLSFLKGLVSQDLHGDAYIFHTRLVRITPALRDHDTLRAAGRLSLMADGFGGGTDIGASLEQFNASYAAHAVNGRTVVIILSDGYCTGGPEAIARALKRLSKRAAKIIWLNPLAGWRDYAPVAAGMAAARPHLDALLPANTIDSLAKLEDGFARL